MATHRFLSANALHPVVQDETQQQNNQKINQRESSGRANG
jgi:hypothetical protein